MKTVNARKELFKELIELFQEIKTERGLMLAGKQLTMFVAESLKHNNHGLAMMFCVISKFYFDALLDAKTGDPTIIGYCIAEHIELLQRDYVSHCEKDTTIKDTETN